ncbi:hypothetical protein BD779DRAFT_1473420 [Infundibulicybe gibba]|nr:hypothetical protein BD779DRAFT_1473420 [Infundibulicybe gibba]
MLGLGGGDRQGYRTYPVAIPVRVELWDGLEIRESICRALRSSNGGSVLGLPDPWMRPPTFVPSIVFLDIQELYSQLRMPSHFDGMGICTKLRQSEERNVRGNVFGLAQRQGLRYAASGRINYTRKFWPRVGKGINDIRRAGGATGMCSSCNAWAGGTPTSIFVFSSPKKRHQRPHMGDAAVVMGTSYSNT